ncbi:O-antigen ligase family protein [Micromonospora chersina]|uniref:O-antigen ligase family protein n=1 Tax=Micromonospora chersina TaxID=47854 RepID=UPI003D9153EE
MTVTSFDFDPSRLDAGTYASRQRRHLVDVAFLLSLLATLALLLPAGLVVPQFSDLGRPATLMGAALATIWMLSRTHQRLATRGPQPMRWAAIAYFTSYLASYVAGLYRGMPSLEASGAERSLLGALAFLGPMVAFADGVPNRRRVDGVIQTLVFAAAGMAAIGVLQSTLSLDLTAYIKVPGLISLSDYGTGIPAAGSERLGVASTAAHYIEFAAVMAMVLPFAVHVARFAASRAVRQWGAVAAVTILAVIPMTQSRTGTLALVVGMVVMLPVWSWRVRYNLVLPFFGLLAAMMVVRPGMLGSVASLFYGWDSDPSVQGRKDDYEIVGYFFNQRPWFGRGQGTFIPTLYTFLDNQWLGQAVSGGIVGIATLAGLHLTAIVLAVIAYRRATAVADRHLCGCLIAVQVIAMVAEGTFDALAFTTFSGVLAVLTGCAGAMWRLLHPSRQVRTTGPGYLD